MTFLKAPLYLLAAMILSLWRSQAFQAPKIRCLRSWADKESPRIKIKRVATTWPPARFSTPVDNSSPTEDSDESLAEFTVSKEQVSQLYELGQYVFAAMGVLLLLMPDRTMTTLLATKCGGAAGFLMAAGLSYILVGANEHDRLGSDTYKRLNVGLLGFSVLGLLAIPGEAGFFPTAVPAFILSGLVTVVRLYGVTAAYVGWSRGVDKNETMKFKPKKLLRELYKGTIETVKGLRVQTAKKALTYRNCLLLVGVGIFSSFMEWIFDLRVRSRAIRRRSRPHTSIAQCLPCITVPCGVQPHLV